MIDDPAGLDPVFVTKIRIVERDGEIVELLATTARGDVTVICETRISGRCLTLTKLHIDGPGADTIGLRELRNIARMFGIQEGVDKVVVQGSTRTTGSRPGHVPRMITIACEKSNEPGDD